MSKILNGMSVIILMVIVACWASVAAAQSIPKYFNYQAVLFDDGGNPLPDAKTKLYIRILDSSMNVIYEEEQDVDVISGVVSVMIGSGVTKNGNADGIGIETLLPDGPKYMEVQAEGYPAEDLLEIVSVPYAAYSDVALAVVDRSVGTEQIKEGAIVLDHFAEGLISELSDRIINENAGTQVMMKGEFNSFKSEISGSGGALQTGVNSDFAYSSAHNVQDVLSDFDVAIKKRAEETTKINESNLSLDGGDIMTGDLQMGGQRVTGLSNPVSVNDAATKGYADQIGAATQTALNAHASSTNNPHSVNPGQIGAATQSALDLHTGNVSNPHSVTPSQIGAVSESDLYSHGVVKDSKIPQNIARISDIPSFDTSLPLIARGRIFNNEFDANYMSGMECRIRPGEGVSPSSTFVICRLTSVTSAAPAPVSCGLTRQLIPQFSILTRCAYMDGNVLNDFPVRASVPANFEHSISLWAPYDGSTHCDEIISFELDIPMYCINGGDPSRPDIRWNIYERSLAN